jgi:hypothetical protein
MGASSGRERERARASVFIGRERGDERALVLHGHQWREEVMERRNGYIKLHYTRGEERSSLDGCAHGAAGVGFLAWSEKVRSAARAAGSWARGVGGF